MTTLGTLIVGNKIKFSKRGLTFTVITRTGGRVLNAVIQLRSENGKVRTHSELDKKWNEEVILVT